MRNLFFFFLFLCVIGCKNGRQSSFEVEGTIKNAHAKTVLLEESSLANLQPVIVDSASIEKDGSFQLHTLAQEESIFSLRLGESPYPFVSFINDADEITIDADLESKGLYTVKGSPASETLQNYLKENGNRMRDLYKMDRTTDSLKKAGASDSIIHQRIVARQGAAQALKRYNADFIRSSKSPALTLFALGSFQSLASNPEFNLEGFTQQEVNDFIAQTAAKFPNHQAVASLHQKIQMQSASAPNLLNKPAPDFTFPDVSGKPVSLSSFKGKYVLVDFWASWCRPCREENPNVVNVYQQFKNKNFTVLGVSLDKEKESWVKAIKDDNLTWTHISDLKFWDSQVVNLYGFEGIPYNVLVDPNGVIIAEGLRGEELKRKLNEVLP